MTKFGGEDRMTAEDFWPENQKCLVSGGISGAITDPYSDAAEQHAELIKNYLFQMEHTLESGRKRFDPCFEIAESWRRLTFDPQNMTI